jgi:hypothetical protein
MGNRLTKLMQQIHQQLYLSESLSPKEVTCEIKLLSKDLIQKLADLLSHYDALSLNQTCKLFRKYVPHRCRPKIGQIIQQQLCSLGFWDVIKHIVDFLNHDDALSLNQTCKLFREYIPHICLPLSTQVIEVDDCRSLENGKLILSEVIMLVRIPLEDSTWIDLIQLCCPNLKYLFIIHECKYGYPYLGLDRLLCVEISMKIKMLNMDCLSIHLPSTMENFTAHIKAFETISGEHMGAIDLRAETLDNLKSL